MSKLIDLLFRGGAALLLVFVLAGVSLAVQPGWYHDPQAPGHGVKIVNAGDDYRALTWYTFGPVVDADGDPLHAEQAWFASENWQPGVTVDLFRPLGYFPSQAADIGPAIGSIRVKDTDFGLRVDFEIFDWPKGCSGQVQVGPPWCTGTVFLELLAAQ